MADMYNIPIGGEKIPVPAWATAEVQSRILRSVDKGNLLNSQGLTVLKSLVKATGASQLELNKLDNALNDLAKVTASGNMGVEQAIGQQGEGTRKAISAGAEKTGKAFAGFASKVQRVTSQDFSSLSKVIESAGDALGNLPIIGGFVSALATGIGAAVGVLEQFAKVTAELNNVGVGLHGSLSDMRMAAAMAGQDFENFGKTITGNQRAIRSLGDNIFEGSQQFGALSRELSNNLVQFGQFGLTNTALNEALADEIELVRLRGQLDKNNLDAQTDSLQNLLREQTALAELTGTDKRERQRARQQALSDSRNALFLSTQTGRAADNLGAFGAALTNLGGGAFGERIQESFMGAIRTGTDFGVFDRELAALSTTIPGIRELFDFYRNNLETMDPETFQAEINSRILGMFDERNVDTQGLLRLADLGTPLAGVVGDAIDSIAKIRGFEDISPDQVVDAFNNVDTAAETGRLGIMGIPAAMESVVNAFNAKILQGAESLVESLTGIDIESAGSGLTTALNSLSNKILGIDAEVAPIESAEININNARINTANPEVSLSAEEGSAVSEQLTTEDVSVAGQARINAIDLAQLLGRSLRDIELDLLSNPDDTAYMDAVSSGDEGLQQRLIAEERRRRIQQFQSQSNLTDEAMMQIVNIGDLENPRFGSMEEYLNEPIERVTGILQEEILELQNSIDQERQRIARSEAGENEYTGFEGQGRRRSASRIEDYQAELVELYRNVASLTEGTGFVLDEAAVSGAFLQGNTVLSGMDSSAPIGIVDADGNQISDTLQSDISRVGGITEEQAANIIRLLSDSLTEQRRIRQNAEE